ncbi:putative Eukaryotic rRNA processing protein EBP2 [Leishmania utingensis]|uniref:Eukaryotic rRNA processing protein EBP2 n=1 Tax=Leishmania utingensis TaxID=653362 RepID=A0AAW2ZXZ8_9TRYP
MPVYDIASRKRKNLLRRRAEEAAPHSEDKDHSQGEDEEEEEGFEDEEYLDSDEEVEEVGEALPKASGASKRGAADAASKSAAATACATRVEFSEPAQWVERMALTSTRSLPSDLNADDDPKREEAFIQQTLLSVVRGISLLEEAGVPWKRPDDYYAEMYKSDVHMNDVRQAMEASKARIEAQAHRRTMKEQKKYGKEVQAEVMRQRAKYKRDMQESLSDWRKKRRGNGSLQDMLSDDEGDRDAKRFKAQRTPRARNLRPGGNKRPGKNARRHR